MKKLVILSMIGAVCLTLGACGASQTTVSDDVSGAVTMQEETTSTEQVTEESETESESEAEMGNELENDSEAQNDSETEIESEVENELETETDSDAQPYETNPVVSFFISPNPSIAEEYKLTTGSFAFYAGEELVASYDNLDLSQGYCFEFDEKLFGEAGVALVTRMGDLETTGNYYHTAGQSDCFGVDLYNDENGLASGLAGGVITHAGIFVDRQGTDEVYSDMTISMNFPKSHLQADLTYDIEIGIYRLTTIEGTGVLDGDVIHFTPNENEAYVCGDITTGEFSECATFTVTESDFSYISVGESFEFPEPY